MNVTYLDRTREWSVDRLGKGGDVCVMYGSGTHDDADVAYAVSDTGVWYLISFDTLGQGIDEWGLPR